MDWFALIVEGSQYWCERLNTEERGCIQALQMLFGTHQLNKNTVEVVSCSIIG